jgi:hypothetical protein
MHGDFGNDIYELVKEVEKDNSVSNAWNTIYHNNIKPLSHLKKGSKYSSMLLPTGDLPKTRNSYDLDSAAGIKMTTGYVLV